MTTANVKSYHYQKDQSLSYGYGNEGPIRLRHTLSKQAFSQLSATDQERFERFSQGPIIDVPYACIHHAFEAHAAINPHAIAVRHLGHSINYQQLNFQANRLATLLRQRGVSNGQNVALFLHRSIPMVVGIIGVLKTGAAYIPQHVGVAPESHLRHIIDSANVKVILTLSSLRKLLPVPQGCLCIAIDEFLDNPSKYGDPRVGTFPINGRINHSDPCFILFTSGTTGTPNGVQVTHGNLCNVLLTAPGSLGMRAGYTVAQILNIAFDMAAWEILGCLAYGATLLIRDKDIEETASQADVIIATPTSLASIDSSRCHKAKFVAVAGEPCPRALADEWASFCTFYNCCGPTETTIVNTMQRHQPQAKLLTIGKPTPNNTVYILDAQRRPCGIGEIGEMWAGGECVSLGYLQNPDLNAERYVRDPFLDNGRMMFRTRDLGRWTSDGELEHLGRVDDQVKVRGFRVELDAIAAVLERIPSCTRAVALKLDQRNLAAFVCPQSVDIRQAREVLAEALPYYCIPTLIVALPDFPITVRGKVDKRALLQIALGKESGVKEGSSC